MSNEVEGSKAENKTESEEICYEKSKEYWAKQPATIDGMLGGFDFVSQADIEQSQKFLDFFLNVLYPPYDPN